MEPTNIFTHTDPKEGNVGLGKIPESLHPVLTDLANEYIHMVPDKSKTTFHTYYTDMQGPLKQNFDKVQNDPFWNKIATSPYHKKHTIMQPVYEMNELYYSNPKPGFEKTNLYGAAANLIPHRDCILFYFPGIRFYRVIIGLTDNNQDTSTEFIKFGVEHAINKGDYMMFDFDRTLHQVKKSGKAETPRILMKLHFITYETDSPTPEDPAYLERCAWFYKMYYYVARYTEAIGTDPTTFMGFFFGLIWEYPFYWAFIYVILFLLVCTMYVLRSIYKVEFKWKNLGKFAGYFLATLFAVYLFLVCFYYARYSLTGIK